MPVPMMAIREMPMRVGRGRMLVGMAVRFRVAPNKIVLMLMMVIVRVRMFMFQRRMRMFVRVVFSQVQPDADAHQQGSQPECGRHGLAQKQDGNGRADKGRGGKIGAGAGCTQVP